MKTWQLVVLVAAIVGSAIGVVAYQEHRQRQREVALRACFKDVGSMDMCLKLQDFGAGR